MRGLGVRVFCLLFDKEQDADVIERMERRPSTMTSYVRELVRRDMYDEQLRKTATMLASARTNLLAENAKLRELCSELLRMAESNDPDFLHWPEVHDELRKVGVEIVQL